MTAPGACILAAGVGNRLGEMEDKPPKALLEFGGKSLLARHLENLARIGVRDVCIGVGYRAEDIEAAARSTGFPGDISFTFNPDYTEGSVITLAVMGDRIAASGPVILMDADVLYDPRMMARLANSAHENCLLVDRDYEEGDEPVKICVSDENIVVDFRKIVDTPFDWCGESVGFFKWSPALGKELIDGAKAYIERGERDAPYEEVIRDAILRDPSRIGYEDVTGIPWVEIDFAQDVVRANEEILPQIDTGIR
ncbi:MAG: NTP transferase domain-containing protein [Alphaproteobacteria bacterium]